MISYGVVPPETVKQNPVELVSVINALNVGAIVNVLVQSSKGGPGVLTVSVQVPAGMANPPGKVLSNTKVVLVVAVIYVGGGTILVLFNVIVYGGVPPVINTVKTSTVSPGHIIGSNE